MLIVQILMALTPPCRRPRRAHPERPRLRCAGRHGTPTIFASLNFSRALLHADGPEATFLLLGLLPHGATPCDHAQATYVFSEEAQLLPCFLPKGTQQAQDLAGVAHAAALSSIGRQ